MSVLKSAFLVLPLLMATKIGAIAGIPVPMPLLAHRAVYNLTLDDASADNAASAENGPMAARGRIVYDFSGSSCEGYVSNFRQVNEVTPRGGVPNVSDVSTQTFEGGHGHSYQFRVQSSMSDKSTQNIDGHAQVTAQGDIAVKLRQPTLQNMDLGKNVIFPTAHVERIIAAAKAGDKTLSVRVYDGSEPGKKTFDTLTVIGAIKTAQAGEKSAQIPQLEGVKRWPVTISYFASGPGHDAPDYILSFDLYENGVSRKLKLDYGTFILDGTLVKLDVLPVAAPCGKP